MPRPDRLAARLTASLRPLLGLDTDPAALAARLRSAGVVPTPTAAAACRSMLLGAPGLAAAVAGIVVRAEDLERAAGQAPLVGVRADLGTEPLSPRAGRVTSGVDGLADRLRGFVARGARFAVWRAFPGAPGLLAVTAEAGAAARFAAVCQDMGVLPVVRMARPETGPTQQSAMALALFRSLDDLGVERAGVVLAVPPTDALTALLPRDLGGVAVQGGPLGGWTGWVGREVTLRAIRAWRGGDVDAGRRALLAGLAAQRPVPLRAAG